jgi:hypothetical protein
MLVSTQTIAARYGEGLSFIADLSYDRFLKELYGLQHCTSHDGAKLLLLLHALDSWDNRAGAQNCLTQLQILRIMDNIAKLRQTNPMGSAYASGLSSGVANAAPVMVRDTNTVDLSLANGQIEASVKLSQQAGNTLQMGADGLYAAPAAGGSTVIKFITGDQFASGTRYDDAALKDMDVQIWHRGMGFLIYHKGDNDNPENEFTLLPDGGFNITIPGFNAKEGTNYFYIYISTPTP